MKRVIISTLLSFLLVMYAPMASVTGAQAAGDAAKLQQMKQKAIAELDRRITKLTETKKKLEVDVNVDSSSASAATNQNGTSTKADGSSGTLAVTVDKNGFNTNVKLSSDVKDKAKSTVQKFIDQLTGMKTKVENSTKLADMQTLGKSIDSQQKLDQVTNVQGTVTKAVESLTGVFDKLKTSFSGLQSQVTKLKTCADDSTGTPGSDCTTIKANASSEDVVDGAQAQLDNVSTMMQTISSVLSSALVLLTTLVTMFSGSLGGLGSLSSLGDVSSLGSLGGLGDMGGLLSSFTAITSQLDIANGMAGSSGGLLGSLSGLTSAFNF